MSQAKAPKIISFPVEKLLSILEEVSTLESLGRSLLKWCVTETELQSWDASPVPLLIDTVA